MRVVDGPIAVGAHLFHQLEFIPLYPVGNRKPGQAIVLVAANALDFNRLFIEKKAFFRIKTNCPESESSFHFVDFLAGHYHCSL